MQEGALPPFGHMYRMPMYIDAEAGKWPDVESAEVAFNAGA